MRLLVTGASGFIGRSFVRHAALTGKVVRAVSRGPAPITGSVEVVPLPTDAERPDSWRDAMEGVEAVVHLAGRAHVLRDRSADPLPEFRRVNVDLTTAIARAAVAAGVRRFVFVSSIGVLGERTLPGHPFTEETVPAPAVPYAISKREAEVALDTLGAGSGLEVVVVRPPLVHGPGAPGNFARLLRLVGRGWPLPLGGLCNRRSFVGVANLAQFLDACVTAPLIGSRPLLPADEGVISTTALVQWIAEDLGAAPRLMTVPGLAQLRRLPMLGRAVAKLTESLEVDGTGSWARLGLQPGVSLRDGLREMSLHHRNSTRDR